MMSECVVCSESWLHCSSLRATQGKGNDQFLAALKDLLATTCNMMSMDCPEGELVAPKAVSCP